MKTEEEKKDLEISNKLNAIISLLIRQLQGEKDFSERSKRRKGIGDLARYLADMRLDTKDIAEILNAPIKSVRTLLTPKRRK